MRFTGKALKGALGTALVIAAACWGGVVGWLVYKRRSATALPWRLTNIHGAIEYKYLLLPTAAGMLKASSSLEFPIINAGKREVIHPGKPIMT